MDQPLEHNKKTEVNICKFGNDKGSIQIHVKRWTLNK